MDYRNEIYLGTVCLEKNRWGSRIPTFRVGDYIEQISRAGFDGIELWENHYLMAGQDELEKLASSPVPIKILGTYIWGENSDVMNDKRDRTIEVAHQLKPDGIKFNFGRNITDISSCVKIMDNWLGRFPQGTRLICEFHKGHIVSFDDLFHAEKTANHMVNKPEVIVHPFGSGDALYAQFAHFGERITHAHVAYPRATQIDIARTVDILRRCGFRGSSTIEFTFGVNEKHEDFEYVFDNAVRDLNVLRENLNDKVN